MNNAMPRPFRVPVARLQMQPVVLKVAVLSVSYAAYSEYCYQHGLLPYSDASWVSQVDHLRGRRFQQYERAHGWEALPGSVIQAFEQHEREQHLRDRIPLKRLP